MQYTPFILPLSHDWFREKISMFLNIQTTPAATLGANVVKNTSAFPSHVLPLMWSGVTPMFDFSLEFLEFVRHR